MSHSFQVVGLTVACCAVVCFLYEIGDQLGHIHEVLKQIQEELARIRANQT
jgi:hypothetical protein